MAKIRLSRSTHLIPDAWRDAIAIELELEGGSVPSEAAHRLRTEADEDGSGASLLDYGGELKRAVLRGVTGAKASLGTAAPSSVSGLENDLMKDLRIPSVRVDN